MLTLKDGKDFIRLARTSIETYFSHETLSIGRLSSFDKPQGVFVTLKKFGRLRGCIGFPEPVYPLHKAVVRAARSAAFEDPRFSPVTEDELQDITIEISVLTVPKKAEVEDRMELLDLITIGRDGIIIRSLYGSGLLLPIVAVEYDWTPGEFLSHTCQKAGLPLDAWKSDSSNIFLFKSQVFSESAPNGDVIEEMSSPEQ